MNHETFGYSPDEFKLFRHHAWRYLILFSLLYAAHYCSRLNLQNASAVMISQLNWEASDIGILTGTLFCTYALGHLVNGRLGEIIGPIHMVSLSIFLSVLCNLLMGFQRSIPVMALIWGLNGYVQSMAWGPGVATLTAWWPGNTRGFAVGFANGFSGFGQVAATAMVALSFALFPNLGWRAAFFIPPLLPLVLLVIYRLFAKPSPKYIGLQEYVEPDEDKARAEEEMQALVEQKGHLYPYKYLLSNPRFLIWMVVIFACGLARYGLVTWIPLYFIERFQIDITDGLLQSMALPVGMGVGTLIVPWLTDRYCPNNRMVAAAISALVGSISIAVFYLLNPDSALQFVLIELMLFVAGFCIYAINGIVWAYATDVGGRVFSGTASGVLDFSAYLGAAIQSVVYGFLLNSGSWGTVFLSIAGFCLLIFLLGLYTLWQDHHKINA